MRIDSFHVGAIDDFGGRTAAVRTSKLEFETPSRAATSTEYNYKKTLKVDEPFENTVGEYVARFNEDDIRNFATKNGAYHSRLRAAGQYADQMKFVVSKAYPQYPFDHAFDDETLRLLIEVQIDGGLDLVSIPHVGERPADLMRHFTKWSQYAERYASRVGRRVVVVPHVPMKLRETAFQQTMRALWDHRAEFPCVGLTYASIAENKINYSFLRQNRDQDTWLHMSSVPRVAPGRGTSDLALMHLPQIYGIDTVSSSIPWGGQHEPLRDYQVLRYFDERTLRVPRIKDWIRGHAGHHRTDCPCPVCERRSFSDIVRNFIGRGMADMSPLFGVFRLHEVFRSSIAFDDGRVYISENDFARYLREHIGSSFEDFRETSRLF